MFPNDLKTSDRVRKKDRQIKKELDRETKRWKEIKIERDRMKKKDTNR